MRRTWRVIWSGPNNMCMLSARCPADGSTPPPPSDYREPFDHREGAAALRARNRHPGISPWLFVMATALNTMVAAVLAVIITLGVETGTDRRLGARGRVGRLHPVGGRSRRRTDATGSASSTRSAESGPAGGGAAADRLARSAAAARGPEARPPALADFSGRSHTRAIYSRSCRRTSRNDPFGSGPYRFRHVVRVARFGKPARDHFARMVDDGVRGHRSAATDEWPGCGASQGLDRCTSAGESANGAAQDRRQRRQDLLAKATGCSRRATSSPRGAMYQRAAEMGSGTAALTLGATYDPNRLWSLRRSRHGGQAAARRGSGTRANELGQPEAKARLTRSETRGRAEIVSIHPESARAVHAKAGRASTCIRRAPEAFRSADYRSAVLFMHCRDLISVTSRRELPLSLCRPEMVDDVPDRKRP